ncbi:hypothetical protein [Aquicoccus sp. SU-CL01552]|uniref:hypothetical protein n=1 Tax=Aquicoccus sp. SU-CL01552 TaxID=3127656 RepID=UPI003105D5B9
MAIDVSGTIAAIPAMSEASRKRLRQNIAAWVKSGEPEKMTAAQLVESALEADDLPAGEGAYDAIDQTTREERLRKAFLRRPASSTETAVIGLLLRHPNETSHQLSRRLGWEGQTWHAHFGKACHAREDLLWRAPPSERRDERFFSAILADYNDASGTWRIKPDLATTLADVLDIKLIDGGGEA